ncbi:upstream stimulatory factor 2 isoform X2 [Maniola hyperantus]|uniref:upstream stimulatory factor 2 isoform X2 n=1 Tax=Aphantopus hyperantus TaxID=2795564 RepID=UPI0015692A5A|nr:upstream stimulatory factor 2 isoform X2 [Maniola hyperantus]
MAKVEIDILENSLDSSGDNDHILGLVGGEAYESTDCGRSSQIIAQPILDGTEDENSTYCFKDITGTVAYKLVQIPEEESSTRMSTHSPTNGLPSGEFYVISNPVQVYGTTAPQKKVIRRSPQIEKTITKKRDDKRRATHNEVERRRRDKINTWIGKLAALIPHSGLPDSASKGGILAKACDHITELTEKQKKLEKLEVDNDKLVLEILRLNKELTELRNENTSMRLQLADNCIVTSHRPKGQRS